MTAKVDELHLTCENLKSQVHEAAVYKADCALLSGENDKLKETVKVLQAAESAKETEIEQLKAEIKRSQRALTNALEFTSPASKRKKSSAKNCQTKN